MNLEIDLYSDWIEILRSELTRMGYTVPAVKDPQEVAILYHDAHLRRVSQRPRKVSKAKDFVCPPELEAGLALLEAKVTAGDDLNPHVSRKILKIGFQDGLLNDWGIQHFHLGTTTLANGLIEGTKLVLFAKVTATDFYEIRIAEHGTWPEVELIESIHANWPDSIKQFRLQGFTGKPSTTELVEIARAKGLYMPITTQDGTSYAPPGGGIASDGSGVQAVENADREAHAIQHLEEDVMNNLAKIKKKLETHGYAEGKPLKAKLILDGHQFRVKFPEYNYIA